MITLSDFPMLDALVGRAQADIVAFGDAYTLTDSVVAKQEGRDIKDADEEAWKQADVDRKASLAALLNHRGSSVAELAAKVQAVCSGPIATEVNEADWLRVYLADAQNLAALAGGVK